MAGRVVAFINFKGGVGKTSNVVNLSAAIAHLHKKKVLVVDLDPQCNSTFWLLKPREFHAFAEALPGDPILERTTYQLFQDFLSADEKHGEGKFQFEQALIRNAVSKEGYPLIQNLDLIPCARALMLADERLCNSEHRFKFTFLFDKLRYHTLGYDYVFLDCPPNVFPITKNALFLASDIVVPFNPDFLSLSGFKFLCRILASMAETYQIAGITRSTRPIGAFILNRSQTNAILSRQAEVTLKAAMDDARKEGLLTKTCRLLAPAVRNSVDLGLSADQHLPVIFSHPKGHAAEDYKALAASFIAQFPN